MYRCDFFFDSETMEQSYSFAMCYRLVWWMFTEISEEPSDSIAR